MAIRVQKRIVFEFCTFVGLVSLHCGPSVAGDWPQILGPMRTGAATDEKIPRTWSEAGRPVVWERPVGSGLAGVAVRGQRAILFHRDQDQEVVEAIDVGSGKTEWKTKYPAKYVPSYINDNGPRCVPLIHGDHVYVYGALGDLRCLQFADGARLWERAAFEDYNSKRSFRGEPPEGYFGIGTSPIVVGENIVVNVGGDENQAGVVAFDRSTGKTAWKATSERASYSAPMLTTLNDVRHLVFATRLHVLSLNPENGQERFRFPFGNPGPNVTGANPVILDDHLFITASYGFGAVFARMAADNVHIEWSSDEILSSQYTTCIAHDGKLYGIHGRQDQGFPALRCIDPTTKKVLWSEENFGYATLIKADGLLLAMKTDGELVLSELDPTKYVEVARERIIGGTARALPALSNGKFYVRNERVLKCIDLNAN